MSVRDQTVPTGAWAVFFGLIFLSFLALNAVSLVYAWADVRDGALWAGGFTPRTAEQFRQFVVAGFILRSASIAAGLVFLWWLYRGNGRLRRLYGGYTMLFLVFEAAYRTHYVAAGGPYLSPHPIWRWIPTFWLAISLLAGLGVLRLAPPGTPVPAVQAKPVASIPPASRFIAFLFGALLLAWPLALGYEATKTLAEVFSPWDSTGGQLVVAMLKLASMAGGLVVILKRVLRVRNGWVVAALVPICIIAFMQITFWMGYWAPITF